MSVYSKLYPEVGAGGFTRRSGTIQFYGRVNALLRPDMTVLDFGAGRGLLSEMENPFFRNLCTLRGKVSRVIGVDVDDAVLENPVVDEAHVFDGKHVPLPDGSVDLVLSDHVFEHIADPAAAAAELDRLLKPGGWICARTPASTSLIAIGARVVPNRLHAGVISKIQPGEREAKDVFPTCYRLNSQRALRRYFPQAKWRDYSYPWNSEPTYHFGSKLLVRLMAAVQAVKPGSEKLFIFLQKKA